MPTDKLLLDSMRDYIAQIREEGMDGLPMSDRPIAPMRVEARRTAIVDAPAPPAASPAPPKPAASVELFSKYPGLEKTADLAELQKFMGNCTRCKLHGGRTNLVFGVGDPKAELMFIGEGPGADEDAQGEPFVGRAGQLLTDIIERGMGMR
ncbi:MAG TPA: uracil-DNA glycosylase family protein, partial [Candidatus Binataceae bacterium]|nr:uracil-DNA glycosylase family protein [Candidatus Binataceae bacterium]